MSRWKSYHITSLQIAEAGQISAEVMFDPEHPLYQGHFPGQPVTPGVCIIGMIGDVFCRGIGQPGDLTEARVIKFHNPLVPVRDHRIAVRIQYRVEESGDLVAKAVVEDADVKYCSLNARYSIGAASTGTI